MSSVRERRRAEHEARMKQERIKRIAKQHWKKAAWGIAAIAVIGLIAAAQQSGIGDQDCPGHWHATQGVFIDGERVPFPQPPYNHQGEGGQLPGFMHMHQGNQEQLHFEPAAPRCQGIQETMAFLDVDLDPDSLTLSGAHERGPYGGTYENDGNDTVRVFIQASGEAIREPSIQDILDYQLRDGERMMITYGEYTMDEVGIMMDQLSWPPGFDPQHEAVS